jgi:hypothetical protein
MSTPCFAPLRAERSVHPLARFALVAAAFLAATFTPTASLAQPMGSAVEYFHGGFGHYFITSYANEIALLDGGAFGGVWTRTGQTIPVWTAAGAGTQATCRFFTEAYAPRSSHFYTPYPGECAGLQQGTTWRYEGVAFHLKVDALGNCPAGSSPLYRLYNNLRSGAPNHRYTTSRVIFDQMVAQGWTAEGAGPQTVFACVPGSVQAVAGSGYWAGATSAGEQLVGAMLDDGSFYLAYYPQTVGIVEGRATFAGTTFAAPASRDFVILPREAEYPANVTGTTVPQSSLSGTIATAQRTRTFNTSYLGPVDAPVPLAQIAGTYEGVAATQEGSMELYLTISPTGAVSAYESECTISGTLVQRGSTGVGNVTVAHQGATCPLGTATTTGVSIYITWANGLLIVAESADRDDIFTFAGNKRRTLPASPGR